MKKTRIIVVVVAIIVLGGLIWFFTRGGSSVGQQASNNKFNKLDATDTVGNFYDQWLKAVKEPSTANPNLETLSKSKILSDSLRGKIASVQKDASAKIDPVLCQSTVPEGISTRSVYATQDKAQMLVTSRDKAVTNQAVVTLNNSNDGWYINDIECSLGEFAPEREFSFEKEGYLLKGSIPAPYNPKNWHLVFEDNSTQGHVVPLFFDSNSQCTSLDGNKSVCKPDQFTEAMKVSVHAQMTEKGATVKKLEFIK